MPNEEELERTFLAKYIPDDVIKSPFVLLADNYIPKNSKHPILRIRKKGDKAVITKKYQKIQGDSSVMIEETIPLTAEEYSSLNQIDGKKFSKKRYSYEYVPGKICEIDVYQDKLKGLVVIDFEFATLEDKENFSVPEFCLLEVTNEEFVAGGMLCGKSYEDLKEKLQNLGYHKL